MDIGLSRWATMLAQLLLYHKFLITYFLFFLEASLAYMAWSTADLNMVAMLASSLLVLWWQVSIYAGGELSRPGED